MSNFTLHSEYAPAGDQPQAIEALVISHNKTLAEELIGEVGEFFPENAVEYSRS